MAGFAPMTQCSLAVSGDGAQWALLNASPDLRAQILATPALQPPGGAARLARVSPLRAVLLTSAEIDCVAGLLNLREKQPFNLFASEAVLAALEANPIFQALDRALVHVASAALDAPFELIPGVTATLFATPGKAPLYLEGRGADRQPLDTAVEDGRAVGARLEASGRTAYVIPGCARVTPELARRLQGAPLVMFDGTVFHDDDMIRAGVGVKTGARMGHVAMAGPEGSLAAFRELNVARKIYVHINNTNPVLRPDAPERRMVVAEGWEIAHDGLEITV